MGPDISLHIEQINFKKLGWINVIFIKQDRPAPLSQNIAEQNWNSLITKSNHAKLCQARPIQTALWDLRKTTESEHNLQGRGRKRKITLIDDDLFSSGLYTTKNKREGFVMV